ncbi:MAG: alpha/beta hydrolase [Planctomycetota bacterium]|nr:alpha/beta hydrolase [Planctomycetota bacterium]
MAAIRRNAIRSLSALAIVYCLALIALVNLENRLVYPGAYMPPTRVSPPSSASQDPPTPSPIPSQRTRSQNRQPIIDVSYRTCDGILLWGRLLESPSASEGQSAPEDSSHDAISNTKETVLVLHGNGNRAVYLDDRITRIANYLNANVLAAEYRGFEDSHTPSEEGLQQDCIAAMDFLCKRYNLSPDQVTIFGTSLGGGCATALAAQRGAKVVILDRTFDRLVDVAAHNYPIFPVRSLMKNRFDSLSHLQIYRGPLIMIHGDRDEVVAMERGRNLFEQAACSPKHWIEIPGLSHMMRLSDHTLSLMQQKFKDFTVDASAGLKPLPPADRSTSSELEKLSAPGQTYAKSIMNIEASTASEAQSTSEAAPDLTKASAERIE